jgi:RNA polymerase sigma-70 factor, ECF subfamily
VERADPAELEALYRRRFAAFARVSISITGNVELGREAVQEAFARAIENGADFRGECPLEAWVWRIVLNLARTFAKRAAYETPTATPADAVATNGRGELNNIRLWVRALPQRQREAVFLRYWGDLDYRTIAAALDIEVGTVSATLSAAHQTLHRSLEEVPQ